MTFALHQAGLLRARATAVDFDPHLHGTYSVVVITRGAARIRSSRWSGAVRAGDVFFFAPYEVHAGHSVGGPAHYEVLYPSETFLEGCLETANPGEVRRLHTEVVPRGRESRELADALSSPGSDGGLAVERCLQAVLHECTFSVEPATASSIVRTAIGLIRTDGVSSTRTNDLARQIGVHPSHLARAFREATGMAPQAYVRQVRVARARELICAGVELSEVAQRVSFSDQSHLTREFRKVFGVPPGALSRGVAHARRPRHDPR